MRLSTHVSNICKAAVFQLRQISRIRDFLTKDATKTIVHSLVTSHLDYCNSVLAGLPNHDIKRLQCIQNAAACLTTKMRKYDHISPILQQLHWLAVMFRITCKILVLTYKAINDLAPPYIKSMLEQYTLLALSDQQVTCLWWYHITKQRPMVPGPSPVSLQSSSTNSHRRSPWSPPLMPSSSD